MAVDVLELVSFDEPVRGVTGERLLKRKAIVNYDVVNGDRDFFFDLRFIGRIVYIFIKFKNFTGSPNSNIELFRNNDEIPETGVVISNFIAIPDTIQNIPTGGDTRLDYNIVDYGWDRMILKFNKKGSTAGIIDEILFTLKDFV